MFDKMWRYRRKVHDWLLLTMMAIPLGVVFATVATGVAHGRATVATETAVIAAGLAVYLATGGSGNAMAIEGAVPGVVALRELRTRLSVPPPAAPAVAGPGGPSRIELRGIRFHYPG